MAGKFKLPSIENLQKAEQDYEEPQEKFRVGGGMLDRASNGNVIMKITHIPRDQIEKNPNNKYKISGIPTLAESIKHLGLVQPLHVQKKTDGGYRLLGGERRLTAIDMLIADETVPEWNENTLIPCVIKGADDVKLDLSPENKERYAIITTNKEQRVYSDADTYMEIQEWKKIIDELREKGIEYIDGIGEAGEENPVIIKGEKTRDIISKTTGISRGQVNKFETVHNKGSEELKNALMDGMISVSQAEKVAKKMTEEEQDEYVKRVKSGEKAEDGSEEKQPKKVTTVTEEMFQKDVNKVMELLQENEISLDEKKLEKYYFYIRQIEKLLGGHK